MFTTCREARYDPNLRTHTFCHAMPERWNIMGGTLAAGLSLKWLSGVLSDTPDFKANDEKAASIPAGCDGLIFLPYLNGERTPHMDTMARGAFIGLTLRHTRAHLLRAVMEGVAFSLSETMDIFKSLNLPMQHLVASGGGAYSSLWRQILADVFNHPISVTNSAEHACIGAAIMAGVASGIYKSVEEACGLITHSPVVKECPNLENQKRYESILPIYKQAYFANKSIFHALTNEVI